MFHITWATFKVNRNQLGTVSVFVMISVPWRNQCAHKVISEKLVLVITWFVGLLRINCPRKI